MPAKSNSAQGVTVEAVDGALPRTFFVMRGHISTAFGFTKEEMAALVRDGTFVAKYPIPRGRARFVRSQVLGVAKRWENKT